MSDNVDAARGERDNDITEEVNKFLDPYRKLISDHEDLQTKRVEENLRRHKEAEAVEASRVEAMQKEVDDIARRTSERLKVITQNADLIKRVLQEKINSDCIPVDHQYQEQVISAVEALEDLKNNFPQSMKFNQAQTTDGMEIVAPLEDTVPQLDIAVTKAENSMETHGVQCNDDIESTTCKAKE